MKNSNLFLIRILTALIFLIASETSFSQQEIGGFNVYYGHLHNHTDVSDGTGTLEQAYNYAKNIAGLDFFGLSDHANQIDAGEWTATKSVADSYNEEGLFVAFRGFEWSHNTLGHVTIVNSEEYCDRNDVTTFGGLLSWLSTRECVAFFNHPGRQNSTGQEFDHFSDLPSEKFVGMELWNKGDAFNVYYYNDGYYSNDGNLGFYDEALMRDWKIGAGGSEDNHSGDWGTRENYRMAVLASDLTRTSIYDAFKNKRFFTTLDKNIKMSFKINGSEMGSTLQGNSGQSLNILLSDDDGEIFTKVELIKNGIVYQTWTPNVSVVNISETLTTSDGEYYYIKVTQTDNDEAISSPVFIEGGVVNTPPVCVITNPGSGEHFELPQEIILTVDASDPDLGGTISQVEFFVDGNLVGTDNTAPYELSWTIPSDGVYEITSKATDDLGAFTVSNPVEITVGTYTKTVSSQINNGNDDAEESDAGVMYITSTDLELVYDSYNTAGNQTVGLRFAGLNIPQDVQITNAYLQFTVDEASAGASNLVISGHRSEDSPAITTSSNNVSNRIKTNSQVNWSPADWNSVGASGSDQQTPDISSIIQEIVNLPAFSQSSAITLIITGSGTRIAEAYEGDPVSAAKLFVSYSNTINNPPVFPENPIFKPDATEDQAYAESIAGTAFDEDPIFYSKVGGPDWLTINSDGNITGTPANGDVGINEWTVQAEDDKGGTTQATLQINVINTNDSPEFIADPLIKNNALVNVAYNETLEGDATDEDTGDVLSFYKLSGPAWLNISEDGTLSGVPGTGDTGSNSWSIQVNDNNGGTATATLEIEVDVPSAYCSSNGDSGSEWIESIQINDETFTTGNNGGYLDNTGLPTVNFESNSSVSVSLSPGFASRSSHQYWAIWIDFDKNGIFENNELVFAPSKNKGTVNGSFQINSNEGITRMRIAMSDSGTPQPCGSIGGGEVEDYPVNIAAAVIYPPVANFLADKTDVLVGELINFSDLSTYDPDSWNWDFGNGVTSTSQNPSTTYSAEGTYTVSLTVSNNAGTDTKTITNYINVTAPSQDPPSADFVASPVSVFVGDPIDFTDLSSNNPTSWFWQFGDGQTSTSQNPSIIYSSPGIYTVILETTNEFGSDLITKTDLITVLSIPVGDYCEPVNIDNSADFIDLVNINGNENASGRNLTGYTLFTYPEFSFDAGSTYSFGLHPFNDKNRNFWRIWIDANGDGDFDDINETLYIGNNKKGNVAGNIIIPSDISATYTRLRISMKTGKSPAPCDDNFSGEVEDYNVNISFSKNAEIKDSNSILIDNNEQPGINIYPNPATDKLYVNIKGWEGEKELRLLDITGRSVIIQKLKSINTELNVSELPGGIYFVSITNNKTRVVRKIKIQ